MSQHLSISNSLPGSSSVPVLPVVLADSSARVPTRGTEFSAGLDLYPLQEITLQPGERAKVATGIKVALPPGTMGQIVSRSGLAVRHGLGVLTGTIDSDYRGQIYVCLFHSGTWTSNLQQKVPPGPITLSPETAMAQLIVVPIQYLQPRVVSSLDETVRGQKGFGSTSQFSGHN